MTYFVTSENRLQVAIPFSWLALLAVEMAGEMAGFVPQISRCIFERAARQAAARLVMARSVQMIEDCHETF
jgi:hypothetical protein